MLYYEKIRMRRLEMKDNMVERLKKKTAEYEATIKSYLGSTLDSSEMLHSVEKVLAETQKWEPIITSRGDVILSQDQIDKRCADLKQITAKIKHRAMTQHKKDMAALYALYVATALNSLSISSLSKEVKKMKYSDTIASIEKILSESGIGLMRITDLQTVELTEKDIQDGIPSGGNYRIISLQVAIPVNK
jgi:hypothetical protein